jgi:hypothetical protein
VATAAFLVVVVVVVADLVAPGDALGDTVAVAVVAVEVRLDGAVVVLALGVLWVVVVVDAESSDVVAATVLAAVEPIPPASATVRMPALATDPRAAETVIVLTRRRARSRW